MSTEITNSKMSNNHKMVLFPVILSKPLGLFVLIERSPQQSRPRFSPWQSQNTKYHTKMLSLMSYFHCKLHTLKS